MSMINKLCHWQLSEDGNSGSWNWEYDTTNIEGRQDKWQEAFLKTICQALTRWLSWLQCQPILQGCGLVPGQNTYLSCKFDSHLGHIWEAANRYLSLTWMFLSLSPLPLSLKSINISSDKDLKQKTI